jgi:hypothetical protein
MSFPGYVLRIYKEDGFDDWEVAVSNPGMAKMLALDASGLPEDYPGSRIRVENFLTAAELERLKLEPGQARKKSEPPRRDWRAEEDWGPGVT